MEKPVIQKTKVSKEAMDWATEQIKAGVLNGPIARNQDGSPKTFYDLRREIEEGTDRCHSTGTNRQKNEKATGGSGATDADAKIAHGEKNASVENGNTGSK